MSRKTEKKFKTTPEEIAEIRPENLKLKNDFIEYLRGTDHSPKTVDVYINNLDIFFIFMKNHLRNKDFAKIKKKDIIKLQNIMLEKELSPARIRNIKSSISSLSSYCENILADDIDEDEEDEDVLKWEGFRNIINKIPAPSMTTVREKTILSEEECEKLLEDLIKEKQYQKACAFALAYSSGRRKSELLRIKISHIIEDNLVFGALYKTPEKIKTKGHGSRGKMLNLYIYKPKFKKYFDLWIEERKRLGVPKDMDDIFVTKNKNGEWRPVSISNFNYWANDFTKRLNKDFYWHCMRHNFCTFLIQSKIPSSVVKEIIGWENLEMVDRYTDLEVDDRLGEFFNSEGIKDDIQTNNAFNISENNNKNIKNK